MKKGTAIGIGCAVLLVIGLGCAGIIGYGVWFGVDVIKKMNSAGDDFLAKIGSGDSAGAYKSAGASLQAEQTEEQFTAAVKKLGLTEYQSAEWSNWQAVGNNVTMTGTVKTKTGGTIPVTVRMVQEGSGWKVISVTGSGAGVTGDKPSTTARDKNKKDDLKNPDDDN